MLTGILSYATSPIWMAVLVLSSVVICMEAFQGHQYFQPGLYTLFPDWPESRIREIASLLTFTIVVLLAPKVLGVTAALLKPALRRGFGGASRLLQSLLIEQLFSMLLAPPMMVFHTTFVVSTLFGKPVSWDAQERGDRGIPFGQAFARHKWHVLLGIVWGAPILAFAPRYIWWMSPVLFGLLFAPFLTVITSRLDYGLQLRRWRLLLTPEETDVPPEVEAVRHVPPIDPDAKADLAFAVPTQAPLTMEPIPLSYPSWRGASPDIQRIVPPGADPTRGRAKA
jgi:membrane glycosyltransferase